MADIKKIATRVSYGNTLVELAQQGADCWASSTSVLP